MSKSIQVPHPLMAKISDFLSQEQISLDLTETGNSDIVIEQSTDKQQCTSSTLYSGGWITCETARALGPKLGITLAQMGRLLNLLDIKIRHCSLGCFT